MWSSTTGYDQDLVIRAIVKGADYATSNDRVNNVEGIDIASPAVGTYTVTVRGYNVPQGPQPYALVLVGALDVLLTPPAASFTANPVSGTAPLRVTFTDRSLNEPTEWRWEFGDGGSSALQHPVYTYTLPGIYTVTLTVSNTAGSDVEIKTRFITVNKVYRIYLPVVMKNR